MGQHTSMARLPQIRFRPVTEFPGWSRYADIICDIVRHTGCRKILEIGAGANPAWDEETVRNLNVQYTITDKDQSELDKVPTIFATSLLDIEAPTLAFQEQFDLVLSRMVLEHVSDGETVHKNIFRLLKPGGQAIHCFSTLWAIPFVMNAILPHKASDFCLNLVNPRDRHQHDKFSARYSWCRGPRLKMIKNFESIGFEVIEYIGYFGHDYYRKFRLLQSLENLKSHFLVRHPIAAMTSYAYVVLKKAK
jgi:SAM-dependent methyltransferase